MTDGAKSRIYLATIAVLLLVILAMAYKFIVAGSTQKVEDGRVAVILEPGERALMLREMREFVAGLQLVADALSRDDMPGVAKASRGMGSARAHDVPDLDPIAMKSVVTANHVRATQNAESSMAKIMPDVGKKLQDWTVAAQTLDQGGQIVSMYHQLARSCLTVHRRRLRGKRQRGHDCERHRFRLPR
jgi:hypothetical protein